MTDSPDRAAGARANLMSFSEMLKVALADKLRPEARDFLEMMAEDAVMEFPYSPEGIVRRLRGRAEVAAHLSGLGQLLDLHGVTAATVHGGAANVVVLEFEGFGQGRATGRPYEQRYVSVITLADGYITSYRDYWNPLAVLEAMGSAETLAAALTAGERA